MNTSHSGLDTPEPAPSPEEDSRTDVLPDMQPQRTPQAPRGSADFTVDPTAAGGSEFTHRYQTEEELGRGGCGAVFSARDRHLQRDIAIKVLLDRHREDPEGRRRFIEEARITGRLQHPGIMPVYELAGLVDRRPFFTMSLVKGQTLAALLAERRDTGQDLPHFLKIFESVCQTMAYAHAEGVIHRDLKPSNILVAPFAVVKVMDWGLAKTLTGERVDDVPAAAAGPPRPGLETGGPEEGPGTWAGTVLGTPAYMPPEQARGEVEQIDYRSDVFGLGAILCEVLTGAPPYVGCSTRCIHHQAMRADLTDAYARLLACRAHPQMVSLARRCLAAHPSDRPADARRVATEVTAHLEADMRRAEQDLVRFFELCLDLFCIAGLDGYFRRVNPNFSRVLGHSTAELLSRPFLDFVHPDDHESTRAEMAKLIQGLPVVRFRNRYRDLHGKYRWFEWTAKSDTGEGVIFAVARDVTDWLCGP
jgi:serine/threonine-protein kinase